MITLIFNSFLQKSHDFLAAQSLVQGIDHGVLIVDVSINVGRRIGVRRMLIPAMDLSLSCPDIIFMTYPKGEGSMSAVDDSGCIMGLSGYV